MISDLDAVDIPEPQQPELPIFKNNDQRKAWLRDYKVWGLWYEDKNIGAKYYKYDFENGARLIAEEYTQPATEWHGEFISSFMHLVGGPKPRRRDAYQNGRDTKYIIGSRTMKRSWWSFLNMHRRTGRIQQIEYVIEYWEE